MLQVYDHDSPSPDPTHFHCAGAHLDAHADSLVRSVTSSSTLAYASKVPANDPPVCCLPGPMLKLAVHSIAPTEAALVQLCCTANGQQNLTPTLLSERVKCAEAALKVILLI